MLLRNRDKVYNTEAEAEAAALELRSEDPDWAYIVSVDPKGSGRALIKIYDENGAFISNFGYTV